MIPAELLADVRAFLETHGSDLVHEDAGEDGDCPAKFFCIECVGEGDTVDFEHEQDCSGMAAKALLSRLDAAEAEGWRPIESAPQPTDWMKHAGNFLLGRMGGAEIPEWVWLHTAYLTIDGWQMPLLGIAGVHGYASLPIVGATHWRPLPPPPAMEGRT